VEACRPLLDERGHQLAVSPGDEELQVMGDAARLEQVVVNLLNNAASFTPPGGRIELTAVRDGTDALLRVRDDGNGIAPDLLPRLFDLFIQGDAPYEPRHGGLGLGLAMVKRLVELHGGHVVARSAGLGRGAEFLIRLPALPARPAESAPPAAI